VIGPAAALEASFGSTLAVPPIRPCGEPNARARFIVRGGRIPTPLQSLMD
jgi:hypothetical protein